MTPHDEETIIQMAISGESDITIGHEPGTLPTLGHSTPNQWMTQGSTHHARQTNLSQRFLPLIPTHRS